MSVWSTVRSLDGSQRKTFIASFLGWTLDAFDFFLLTFVTLRIAKDFHVSTPAVVLTITLTLMMRPLGALTFWSALRALRTPRAADGRYRPLLVH